MGEGQLSVHSVQVSYLQVSSGIAGVSSAAIGRIADDIILPGKTFPSLFNIKHNRTGFGGRSRGSKT